MLCHRRCDPCWTDFGVKGGHNDNIIFFSGLVAWKDRFFGVVNENKKGRLKLVLRRPREDYLQTYILIAIILRK